MQHISGAPVALTVIGYLVHDTDDAAVARRVAMMRAGGAQVRLGGFNRRGTPAEVAGVGVTNLGRTADSRLAARAAQVLRNVAWPARARSVTAGTDVIVARNLETLALAVRVAAPGQRVVYECLDIHRLMLSSGRAGAVLRAVERRLLRRVDLIVTSSPAFRDRYFLARQAVTCPIRIEENRLLALDGPSPPVVRAAPARPWRIGWFGMIRCAKSLAMLRAVVRDHPGLLEVTIAGIPSYTEFADFDADVADVPGLRFTGRYTADDLPGLYASVDFAWAIDYFEEGLNSVWLLPNRLYESLSFGAIPIALASVETGRWLERHGVGMRLDDPARDLVAMLDGMSPGTVEAQRSAIAGLPRQALVADRDACRALVAALAGTG